MFASSADLETGLHALGVLVEIVAATVASMVAMLASNVWLALAIALITYFVVRTIALILSTGYAFTHMDNVEALGRGVNRSTQAVANGISSAAHALSGATSRVTGWFSR